MGGPAAGDAFQGLMVTEHDTVALFQKCNCRCWYRTAGAENGYGLGYVWPAGIAAAYQVVGFTFISARSGPKRINNAQIAMLAKLNFIDAAIGIVKVSVIQAVNSQSNTTIPQALPPYLLYGKCSNVPSVQLEKRFPGCRDRPVLRIGIEEADIKEYINTCDLICNAMNSLYVMPKQGVRKVIIRADAWCHHLKYTLSGLGSGYLR